jgi:hypothetical protein
MDSSKNVEVIIDNTSLNINMRVYIHYIHKIEDRHDHENIENIR